MRLKANLEARQTLVGNLHMGGGNNSWTDASLTQPGKAADAKAVGDALKEINAVKTVNGVAPDENGNVEVEIPEAKIDNIAFSNIAEMKNANQLNAGNCVVTAGYYAANDGGAGVYSVRGKTEADAPDGCLVVELKNNLVAELVRTEDKINALQLGAKKGDDIQPILEKYFADSRIDTIFLPKGTYRSSKTIAIPAYKTLELEGYLPFYSTEVAQHSRVAEIWPTFTAGDVISLGNYSKLIGGAVRCSNLKSGSGVKIDYSTNRLNGPTVDKTSFLGPLYRTSESSAAGILLYGTRNSLSERSGHLCDASINAFISYFHVGVHLQRRGDANIQDVSWCVGTHISGYIANCFRTIWAEGDNVKHLLGGALIDCKVQGSSNYDNADIPAIEIDAADTCLIKPEMHDFGRAGGKQKIELKAEEMAFCTIDIGGLSHDSEFVIDNSALLMSHSVFAYDDNVTRNITETTLEGASINHLRIVKNHKNVTIYGRVKIPASVNNNRLTFAKLPDGMKAAKTTWFNAVSDSGKIYGFVIGENSDEITVSANNVTDAQNVNINATFICR